MKWLNVAAESPGKSLAVGIILWHLSGMTNSRKVKLTSKMLADAGVQRHAAYRALKALELRGLISVIRSQGHCPIVTIISS